MEITEFILKDEVKEVFSLNDKEVKELFSTFNITTDKQLTKKTLQGMYAFLKRTKDIKDVNLDNLSYKQHELDDKVNLEELIKNRQKNKFKTKNKHRNDDRATDDIINVTDQAKEESNEELIGIIGKNENLLETSTKKDKAKLVKISFMQSRYDLYIEDCKKNDIEPIHISEYKKYKDYPIDSSYVFDKVLNKTTIIENGLRKISNAKEASKIYNNGYIVYYIKKGLDTSILCKLDTTKQFAVNLNLVSQKKYHSGFEFYTKCERFDLSFIEKIPTYSGKEWTKEEDEKILAFYNSDDYADSKKKDKNNSLTLKEFANSFGVHPGTIRNRALELGFTNFKKPKERNWSPEEIKLLEKCAGKYNPKKISKIFKEKGFTRGFVAIGIKLKRLGYSLKLDGSEDLNLKLLSDVMGVDSHFFYDNNRLEKLNAINENNQWIFNRRDIAKYLRENPYDYSLAKVEPKWFIDILTSEDINENV
jgi:hypothetical protein